MMKSLSTKQRVLVSAAVLALGLSFLATGCGGEGADGGSSGDGDSSTGGGGGSVTESEPSGDGNSAADPAYTRECSPISQRWRQRPVENDPEAEDLIFGVANCFGYEDAQPDKPDLTTVEGGWLMFITDDMVAGEQFAMSWDGISDYEDRPVRIWGLDESCGARQELLYDGILQADGSCVSFTPSKSYMGVLAVFPGLPYNQALTMTYCQGGSCSEQ